MPRLLRRALRWTALALLGLAALVVLALATVLVGANTAGGRRLIETEAASLTGGTVRLAGLHGRFPDRLRIDRIAVADASGPWLVVTGAALDWHPLALLGLDIAIDRLHADRIAVARLPVAAPAPARPAGQGGGIRLPLGLRLRALEVARLEIASPVIGRALALSATGRAAIRSLDPILDHPGLDNLPRGTVALELADLGAGGTYALAGDLGPHLALHLHVAEPKGGLVATLARSDQLGPLRLDLDLAGPRRREALALALDAGPLTAHATGAVDLAARTLAIDVAARAPAMTPVSGVSWGSLDLSARVTGPFTRPAARGRLAIARLAAGGAAIADLDATLSGEDGRAAIRATIAGLRLPGPAPALLEASPVVLAAETRLDDPARPVELSVTHPLLRLAAHARTAGGPLEAHLTLDLPALAPLAAAAGQKLDGHAGITADLRRDAGTSDLTAKLAARLAILGGTAPIPALLGPDATLALDAARAGDTLSLRALALDGAAIHLAAHGTRGPHGLDAAFHLALPDLARATPAANGDLSVDGTASGPTDDLVLALHAAGAVGARGVPRGPVTLDLSARHVPRAPEATLALAGRLDGAPVTVAADLARDPAGAARLVLRTLDWKSAHATADLTLAPGARLPTGRAALAFARLADLDRLAGRPLAGALTARIDADPAAARLDLEGRGLAAAGAAIGTLRLAGTVRDPVAHPSLALALDLADARAAGIASAALHATARGPLDALALAADAELPDLRGAPAHLSTALTLDAGRKTVLLRALAAGWHGETLSLAAPARIAYAPGIAVQHLALALAAPGAPAATLRVDGTVSPALRLAVDLDDLTPALARPFAPTLDATGTVEAHARLSGTTAAPAGTIRLDAQRLGLRTGPAAALPRAALAATAVLRGGEAAIEGRLDAGPRIALALRGRAPLAAGAPLALAADGTIDLSVLNPILEQQGRHASGRLSIDATAAGTTAAPRLGGTVRLDGADVTDYAQGLRLTGIAARLALAGRTVTVERLEARAGRGTIALSGTIGALEPGLPLDLRLVMRDASPVSSDLLSAVLDADIRVSGHASGRMAVAGRATIARADINIPNSLPASVATLHVIRPGEPPPPPAAAAATPARVIALDLTVDAPGQIFVRGHGLDATLGGRLHAGGTVARPEISGGFQLRRGTFSLAGTDLTFTKGDVGFNGTTNGRLDPTIDFVAEQQVQQYDARLEVTGYASKPQIRLASTPALPQDQILGLLLFGSTTASLSPFQIAQIATALASLSSGGGGFDPLSRVRTTLGLDRLTVGSATGGNGRSTGASIEGGKYITRRIYVGARQNTGGGTQALAQYDITRRLKAFTTVGTGGTVTGATTPENDPGSTIGLKYQFRY